MGIESNQSTPEFDAFVASGEVEIGDANAGAEEGDDKEKKPAPKRGPPKEAAKPAATADDDEGDDQGGEGDDEGDDEGEEKPKPKKTAAEHQIERLKREKRDLQRQLREGGGNSDLTRRLENIEKGLSGANSGDNQNAGTPAPDPSDTAKYPLGHLDDRYIEDKLEWLADQKATKLADSALQRQQENERNAAINRAQEGLLDLVDDLSAKGSEQFEDFQESVVEAGMRGDYDLGQATFEACAEADNGPQILYDLSQDKKEAARVAKLTPYGQLKFVQERDAEIGAGKKPRTKPKAGDPPKNLPRGANSKTTINPATDNLNDFEKAWEKDAKGKK
jgi:hypothetical protein